MNPLPDPMNALPDQRVLERLRGEYLEMPGMNLSIDQIRRLCGIDKTMCALVVESLVTSGFLLSKPDGTFRAS